jgi:hypothetical protein
MRRWRRGAAIALALLVLTPIAAQAEAEVYDFNIVYRGSCSSRDNPRAQLRFEGDQAEFLAARADGDLQLVGTGRLFPDGRFEIDVSDAAMHIGGRIEGSVLTADGSFGFGSGCVFHVSANRTPPGGTTTIATTTTTVLEEEEFNPATQDFLSNGEVLGLLRGRRMDQGEIDAVLREGRGSGEAATTPGAVARRYLRLLGALANTSEGNDRAYPTLYGLSGPNGPIARLGPALVNGPPEAVVALNRLVRLAISLDQPSDS